MENFEIPERITVFDSRMKLIVAHYYCPDKQTRRSNFKRLFNACGSASIREELTKYWASMPLRLAKKSTKKSEDNDFKPHQTKTGQVKKSETKIFALKSDKIANALTSNIKVLGKIDLNSINERTTTNAVRLENEIDENNIVQRYGRFLKDKEKDYIMNELIHNKTKQKVNELFDSYCCMYKEAMLARFLLACYNPKLSLHPKNLQREVQLLLEGKKKERGLKIKQRPPQLVYVPWETIEFGNGRVMFYSFRLNGRLILKSRTPFIVNCKESKAIYNHIRKHFANVLPLIRAYQKGADIVGLESDLHLLDTIRILQSKQYFVEWESDESDIKFSSSFNKSIGQDHDKILANLRLRKSAYFDYLSQSQIKGKNPVPCTELLTHTYGTGESEDAFIFSVKSYYNDEVKLVFENVNEARATIVFEVMPNMYEKALRCIFDFMRSDEHNKRQRLHYKKFNFQNHGITRYYFINHTMVGEWKYNL